MPYCPECGSEYRSGSTDCVDCGAELVEEENDELLPDLDDDDAEDEESDGETEESDELLEIYNGPPYAASLVVNALKDRSILAVIQPEIENSLIAPTEASVYVSETDFNEYEDLIRECLELVEMEEDQGALFGAMDDE